MADLTKQRDEELNSALKAIDKDEKKEDQQCTMCRFVLIFSLVGLILVLVFVFFFRTEVPINSVSAL